MSDSTIIPPQLASIHPLMIKVAQLQVELNQLSVWLANHQDRDRAGEKASPGVRPTKWRPGQGDSVTFTGDSVEGAARTAYLAAQISNVAAALEAAKAQLVSAQTLAPMVLE